MSELRKKRQPPEVKKGPGRDLSCISLDALKKKGNCGRSVREEGVRRASQLDREVLFLDRKNGGGGKRKKDKVESRLSRGGTPPHSHGPKLKKKSSNVAKKRGKKPGMGKARKEVKENAPGDGGETLGLEKVTGRKNA